LVVYIIIVILLVNTVFVFMTVAGQTKICDVQGMRCMGNYSGKNQFSVLAIKNGVHELCN